MRYWEKRLILQGGGQQSGNQPKESTGRYSAMCFLCFRKLAVPIISCYNVSTYLQDIR